MGGEANPLKSLFEKLSASEGYIGGLPSDVESVRTILRGRPMDDLRWENGEPCDPVEALSNPRTSLGYVYKNGTLAAVVEETPEFVSLNFFASGLKLELEKGRQGYADCLRLFIWPYMLQLEQGDRRTVTRLEFS